MANQNIWTGTIKFEGLYFTGREWGIGHWLSFCDGCITNKITSAFFSRLQPANEPYFRKGKIHFRKTKR